MADLDDRHAEHDPLLIAALLDDDPESPEEAVARARIVTCPACAALHADLLALSVATRALPTPPRPRDFRLTAADAARLAGAAEREPGVHAGRLTGVMTGTRDHASHDTLLVAALADRALAGTERVAAEALVASCSLCARLHADLVAISVATRAMPTPARTRDFSLTPADAERLRPSVWRRFIAAFGTSRDAFSRPLAAGLTAIGLAGLLFATIPGFVGQQPRVLSTTGNAVGAPAGQGQGQDQAAVPSAAATNANPGAAAPVPAASAAASIASIPDRGQSTGASAGPLAPGQVSLGPVQVPSADASGRYAAAVPLSSEDVYSGSGEGPEAASASGGASDKNDDLAAVQEPPSAQAPGGPSTMVIVSGVLLIVGLGLFLIRRVAARSSLD